MISSVVLNNITTSQVREEAAKAAHRKKAGQGKRAALSNIHTIKVNGVEIMDLRAFDDDGMLQNICRATASQSTSAFPSTALDVLKANTDAYVTSLAEKKLVHEAGGDARQNRECEVMDAQAQGGGERVSAVPCDARDDRLNSMALLDVNKVKTRAKLQEERDMERVRRQRRLIARVKAARHDESGGDRCIAAAGRQDLVVFRFDSLNLSADQRWEGTTAPEERARESDTAPEDPGAPGDPRPRVSGIEPFFKYGYLPLLHKLYLQRVSAFYTKKRLKNVLAPLVNQEDETALRQLDWLVTNYCKEHNLCVVGLDGKQRHVHTWYVALREALRKRHFEPFGKKWRVAFKVDARTYRTTAGQAVFVMEAFNAGVLQYAKKHCAEIDLHLRRQHRRRDKRKRLAAGKYKRAPLTEACMMTTTIVKESQDAVEDVDVGDEEEFVQWLDDAHRKQKKWRKLLCR